MHDCEITIVVPVYRNGKTLGVLIDEVHKALDESAPSHLILMVDDASPDNSWSILSDICDKDTRVGGIRLNSNYGQQMALLRGLSLCKSPWIAVMDADLQDTPELLPKLLEKARDTNATVFAERHGHYESWDRLLTSKIYKTILHWITGAPIRSGTFFLTSERVIKEMLKCDTPVVQVVVMLAYVSSSIVTVPFKRIYRSPTESGYTFRARIDAAKRGFQCMFYCSLSRVGLQSTKEYKLPLVVERTGWVKNSMRNKLINRKSCYE